ncbi:aspartate racemase [Kineothrix alysoides]|uniref:Aspartate racemase n=1 Tax=Kineothrix alysoides TaxID=1469948 RepID=A0A4R1QUG4_9FIRM|nr:aspartate/glutamate racemase family protein [Kineothrix alysoides]TCL57596.1 aspartate racemase [Kineothrix alysoides]
MSKSNTIGIVGGLGPYASMDTAEKVFLNTIANKDQDHLPLIMISRPCDIPDRSSYLLGKTKVNPAYEIIEIIKELENAGANIIGIPCNTAHALPIMSVISNDLRERKSKVVLINMVDEVIKFITNYYPEVKRVGVLSSLGTYISGLYRESLTEAGYDAVFPSEYDQYHKI